MPGPLLEEVFKQGGVPTHTFVEPKEYKQLLISLRTPGRGVVVEGPSGIGKTSAIEKALEKLSLSQDVVKLSARSMDDVEYIAELPALGKVGTVIVDDFHKLSDDTKSQLADYMKILADEGATGAKLVILGIAKAGESLISFGFDLSNRIEIIKFESNPEFKVMELIKKGESALNIDISMRDELVTASQGSFYTAQMLCHALCLAADITERSTEKEPISVSFEGVQAEVWNRLARQFRDRCERFCRGNKFNPSGRAPYLHILNWLANGSDWTLNLRDAAREHKAHRGSVGQVVDKGFLENLISGDPEISGVLHYDSTACILSIEDPQFVFYIRNLPWKRFAKELGFLSVDFKTRYDFALSFAGADRGIAEKLFEALQSREVEVFYDRNEQHRMLAEDIEEYLRPIYQAEAGYVVCILGREYPERIWTKFESDAFKERFGENAVIPIWFPDNPPGFFDETYNKGGIKMDLKQALDPQIQNIAELLCKKLGESN